MVKVCSIASGSNGNCYYVEDNGVAVLIDAGISCKQIVLRMEKLGLDISKVKGLFISHEHIDHIRGVNVFSKQYLVPVFINKETYDKSKLNVREELLNFISANEEVGIENLLVKSFSKIHDAENPVSFSVFADDKKISFLTDIGDKCSNVVSAIKDSDVIFMETNYDSTMLEEGRYPYFLKERIRGGLGHLSNNQAGAFITSHASSNLKYVFLSHLSENNNCPKLALETFESVRKHRKDLTFETVVTDRYSEINLREI